MGYIIVSEEKLKERLTRYNDKEYLGEVWNIVKSSEVDCSYLLEALKDSENKIDDEIVKLSKQKEDIRLLMKYAK